MGVGGYLMEVPRALPVELHEVDLTVWPIDGPTTRRGNGENLMVQDSSLKLADNPGTGFDF